jgi:hypothetical protein
MKHKFSYSLGLTKDINERHPFLEENVRRHFYELDIDIVEGVWIVVHSTPNKLTEGITGKGEYKMLAVLDWASKVEVKGLQEC